jgi:hypothetical protein
MYSQDVAYMSILQKPCLLFIHLKHVYGLGRNRFCVLFAKNLLHLVFYLHISSSRRSYLLRVLNLPTLPDYHLAVNVFSQYTATLLHRITIAKAIQLPYMRVQVPQRMIYMKVIIGYISIRRGLWPNYLLVIRCNVRMVCPKMISHKT